MTQVGDFQAFETAVKGAWNFPEHLFFFWVSRNESSQRAPFPLFSSFSFHNLLYFICTWSVIEHCARGACFDDFLCSFLPFLWMGSPRFWPGPSSNLASWSGACLEDVSLPLPFFFFDLKCLDVLNVAWLVWWWCSLASKKALSQACHLRGGGKSGNRPKETDRAPKCSNFPA